VLLFSVPCAHLALDKEIIRAAQAGNAAKIEALLTADPSLVEEMDSGMRATALHWAAIYGRKFAVAVLLRFGADVSAPERRGGTPMHWAAHFDDPEVIEWFLEKGAGIDRKNRLGRTPLHVAARRGCTEVIKKLVEKGADIDAVTRNGDTALHIAARNGHQDTVDFLIDSGISGDVENKQGETYRDLLFSRPETIEIDPKIYDDYKGVYSVNPNWNLYIRKEDDRLYYYSFGKDQLLPLSENRFISDSELLSFTFLRDESGEVRELILISPNGEQKGTRIQ